MTTAVLFIGWNGPRAGLAPEARAYLEAYGLPYLQSLQLEGCERIEAAGGVLKGRAFLFGERAALDKVAHSDEFSAFTRDMARYFEQLSIAQGIPRDTWSRRPSPRSRSASAHASTL
jgi:hypothetical protein